MTTAPKTTTRKRAAKAAPAAPAAAPAPLPPAPAPRLTLEALQAELAGGHPDAAVLVAHAHANAVATVRAVVARPDFDADGAEAAHAHDQAVRLLVAHMLATGNAAARAFDDLPALVRYLLLPFRG